MQFCNREFMLLFYEIMLESNKCISYDDVMIYIILYTSYTKQIILFHHFIVSP